MAKERQINSTARPMTFLMVLSIDGQTPATGLSPTVTISKNGGAFGAAAGAVTEIGNGLYALAGNATDRNTLGEFNLYAIADTADDANERYDIIAGDPYA